jgi:hypothetical protein
MAKHQSEPNAQSAWTAIQNALPPDGVVVDTKIDDGGGERNHQTLKRSGRLWFVPDGSMYVYYTPTHWRSIPVIGG